jgi:hypothetical protein
MMDRAQIYSKLTTVFREVLDEDDIGLKILLMLAPAPISNP